MEDAGFVVVDPDDGVVMVRHKSLLDKMAARLGVRL
jgi:hypothetical protein